jgi:hypothetical protein
MLEKNKLSWRRNMQHHHYNKCPRREHIGANLNVVFLNYHIVPSIDSELTKFRYEIERNFKNIAKMLSINADKLMDEWKYFNDTCCYWLPKYCEEDEAIAV